MKICHVSFGLIKSQNLEWWINSISYHTRVLERLADRHKVVSFHFGSDNNRILRNGVIYKFLKFNLIERLFLERLISEVMLEAPDVIIIHGMHSHFNLYRLVQKIRNKRMYIQHHGEKVFRWPMSMVHKKIDRCITGYFFSSAAMGIEWIRNGLISNSIKVIEVLEATSSFEPVLPARGNNRDLTFLWVGRINQNKNPETLIKGFIDFLSERPDAKLYIISQDPEVFENKLGSLTGSASESIQFIGRVDHVEIRHWFSKVNFIISTSFYEGSGISVLEAMSFGCIPVLTNIPSFRAMTGNATVGLLFEAGSTSSLTAALSQAAKLDIEKQQQKVFDHFRNNLSAERIAKHIEAVITRP
jgi:glycosyltransferase involved in cell wall biosynthesis